MNRTVRIAVLACGVLLIVASGTTLIVQTMRAEPQQLPDLPPAPTEDEVPSPVFEDYRTHPEGLVPEIAEREPPEPVDQDSQDGSDPDKQALQEQPSDDVQTLEPLDSAEDPRELRIADFDISGEIDLTGPGVDSNRFDPAAGRLDLWLDEATARPCEAGPSFILGHVEYGGQPDVFTRLTRGPNDDRSDGVEVGATVIVELVDGTECVYEVIEFDLEIGKPVDGTPAHRFRKDDWSQTYWQRAIAQAADRPLLLLLTSSGTEVESSQHPQAGHRVHNDAVMAELVEIR